MGWEVIDFDFQVYTLSFLNSFYNLLYNSLYSQVFVLCRALVKKFLSEQKCKALQVKSIGFLVKLSLEIGIFLMSRKIWPCEKDNGCSTISESKNGYFMKILDE